MWTFQRYAKWLDSRTNWSLPGQNTEPLENEPAEKTALAAPLPPVVNAPKTFKKSAGGSSKPATPEQPRIEIEPTEGGLQDILKKFG